MNYLDLFRRLSLLGGDLSIRRSEELSLLKRRRQMERTVFGGILGMQKMKFTINQTNLKSVTFVYRIRIGVLQQLYSTCSVVVVHVHYSFG